MAAVEEVGRAGVAAVVVEMVEGGVVVVALEVCEVAMVAAVALHQEPAAVRWGEVRMAAG
jgi:hypothetical protein